MIVSGPGNPYPYSRICRNTTYLPANNMDDHYVVPSMISQAPFRDSNETNPQGKKRDVFLRRKPLKQSWRGKTRHLSKFARYPPIAHWAIEIRTSDSPSGLVWEIKPVAATNWELDYDFGRWEYSSPKHIKASEKKLGTTILTDKEIDKIGTCARVTSDGVSVS